MIRHCYHNQESNANRFLSHGKRRNLHTGQQAPPAHQHVQACRPPPGVTPASFSSWVPVTRRALTWSFRNKSIDGWGTRLREVAWKSPEHTFSPSGPCLLSPAGSGGSLSAVHVLHLGLSSLLTLKSLSQNRSLKSNNFYYEKCQSIQKQHNSIMIP